MSSESVLDKDNQHLVREAYCWNAVLQNRKDDEFHVERMRPFNLMKPKLFMDGDKWCCLYGENIQDGLSGFGATPAKAAYAFDNAFNGHRTQEVKTTEKVDVPE